MLLRFLKDLRRPRERAESTQPELPQERFARLHAAHAAAPRDRHLEILLGDLRIGDEPLNDFMARCMRDSFCDTPPLKWFRRPVTAYVLARYFLHTLGIDGERAECGVFQGTSALGMCRAARTVDPAYAGERLHLFDSFEGLSEPGRDDWIDAAGATESRIALPAGSLSASIDIVRESLREFPAIAMHRGWIPAVYEGFPEKRWSFVHVDLDLYEPTYGSLEYFYPRLAPGGVIVCDDYGTPMFPGAHRAWDRYCEEHDIPFVVLDTGQSVILKP